MQDVHNRSAKSYDTFLDSRKPNMPRMNFRHLQYFQAVVQYGGVRAAAEKLHLTPQTVSSQLKLLEHALGTALLTRKGRRVEPTEAGQVALNYAQEIFALGDELGEVLRGGSRDATVEFRVGILDSIPKSIAHWLLEPALSLPGPVRIICRESSFAPLLAELAVHKLDLVIADAPYPPGLNIKCFNHPLGESPLCCFGTAQLARRYKGRFPHFLDGAPLLLPRKDTAWRRALLAWIESKNVRPQIRGEFDDTALMKTFAHAGAGFLFAPATTAAEICRQYDLRNLGTVEEVKQSFVAISVERRILHPAVRAITTHARGEFDAERRPPPRRRNASRNLREAL
jgi:LysR family transcriptional regulator, transcriptional activator of nhaA